MCPPIELGLDTFGDITDGPDGRPKHAGEVIRDLIEEAVLADETGVDFIGGYGFIDQVADDLRRMQRLAIGAIGDVAESVEAEFDGWHLFSPLISGRAGTSGR